MKFPACLFFAIFLIAMQPAFGDSTDSASRGVAPAATSQPVLLPSHWTSETTRYFADRGITFQGMSVHDISAPPSGREGSPSWFGRYSLDFSATLDGQKAIALPGFQATMHLKQHLREFGSGDEDVAQPYSNIDADSRTTLYEFYGEQKLLEDRIRVKAGKIDANTDFATVATAADFVNSSMVYSPTIMSFPTYPEPKAGAETWLTMGHGYSMGGGAFKARGHGEFYIGEAGRNWTLGKSGLAGRGSAGYWNLRGNVERFDGDPASSTSGFYGVLEQALWQKAKSGDSKDQKQLLSYLQIGWGNGAENPYTLHIGPGVVLKAPFRRRQNDALGLAATFVRFSTDSHCGFGRHPEFVAESYYKLAINHNLSLVQDLQLFSHPSGSADTPVYLVVTPRLVVTF